MTALSTWDIKTGYSSFQLSSGWYSPPPPQISQLHKFRVDRQLYSPYFSLLQMVQFKLSALFILAAAVVAPTVAVPTGGSGNVQGATSQPAQSTQQSAQSAPISQQFAPSAPSSQQSSQQSAQQSTQSSQSIGKSK